MLRLNRRTAQVAQRPHQAGEKSLADCATRYVMNLPVFQGMYVVKAIEPDSKEVVHQDGAVSRIGVNQEGSGWVCIIKGIAHRAKRNLQLSTVSSLISVLQQLHLQQCNAFDQYQTAWGQLKGH